MTKHERAKLLSAMRGLITSMLASGERVTTSDIYSRAVIEMPEQIEDAKERLFRQSMTNIARGILKEAMKDKEDGSEMMQVSLFGNIDRGLQVPRCIALPSPDGGREMIWTRTLDATVSELNLHIDYLRNSAAADVAKAKKLSSFLTQVTNLVGADDLDTPISILMQGLSEKTA